MKTTWYRNGLYQSRRPLKKAHSYKSRVYKVEQYYEGSRNACKFTIYPSSAYNGIGRGSGVSLISLISLLIPKTFHYHFSITPLYDSILNLLNSLTTWHIILEIVLFWKSNSRFTNSVSKLTIIFIILRELLIDPELIYIIYNK